MSNTAPNQQSLKVDLALCIDSSAIDRFQSVLRHLVVGLIDESIRVRLISSDRRIERLQLGPVKIMKHLPMQWPFAAQRLDALLAELQSAPPTIVHAAGGESYRKSFTIADTFDVDMIATVTSMRDVERLIDFDLTRVQKFIALTNPLVNALRDQLQISDERIQMIRPGIRINEKGKCFNLEGRVPTILCTAPFERKTQIATLIKAVHRLTQEGSEVMLFLLGHGRHEGRLRRLVRELRLSARVTFANPLGDPAEAMEGADLFVSISADTSIDVDGLRAMGCGMAVIAFENPVDDCFKHEETALVCKPDEPVELAEAISRMLDDHGFAKHLAAAGQAYIKANHAMSGMAERTIKIYRELAPSRATFPIKE